MFTFKQFEIDDSHCGMKVGTDGVILGAWVDCTGVVSVVDAGSGSGLISLMLAQRNRSAHIVGIDVDCDACDDARKNVGRTGWSDRVEIRCGNVLDIERSDMASPFLLVSNPPFFKETLRSPDTERSLARHGDGFDPESLIDLAGRLLVAEEDSLSFIAPASRIDEIEFRLAVNRMYVRRRALIFSRSGRPALRVLYQVGKGNRYRIEDSSIVIRDGNNKYTEQYKKLTSEFYLDI